MAGRLKAGLTGLALAASLPLLGACAGFTPLYAQQGLAAGMSAIAVETPQTRTGYLLREQLEDQLAVRKDTPAQYRLAVVIVERRRPRGLNPDDTPTRYELKLDLTYTLTEIAGGKVVLKGAKPIFISTDAVVQPYASVAAQQDAELRAATEAAELIRTDVALALAGK